MRDILFRGKSRENGEWIYGSLIKRTGGYHWAYADNNLVKEMVGE